MFPSTWYTPWCSLEDAAESKVCVTRAPAGGSETSDCLRCAWNREESSTSCHTLISSGLWNLKFLGFGGITLHLQGWKRGIRLLGPTLSTCTVCTLSRPGCWSSFYFGFCGLVLSNNLCSSICGNLQVKPERKPRCATFLQSFVTHTNYRGWATEFPSQGQYISLLSWSLSKQHSFNCKQFSRNAVISKTGLTED